MPAEVLSKPSRDVHRAITDKIVAAIELGPGTYECPWHRASFRATLPVNAYTGKPYRGVNVLSLWTDAVCRGYANRYWASYRQWTALGAQVRRGEHGALIVFYQKRDEQPPKKQDAAEGDQAQAARLVARGYTVFNSDQVNGWSPPAVTRQNLVKRLDAAEMVIVGTGAEVREGRYDIACYDPALDRIDMPARDLFKGTATISPTEAFYVTLFHELTHWTGHSFRLARDLKSRFGDTAYAVEELVAELGAAFLAADLDISPVPRPDHAAYVGDWLRVLKRDPRALMTAASKASDAVAYILDPVAKTK